MKKIYLFILLATGSFAHQSRAQEVKAEDTITDLGFDFETVFTAAEKWAVGVVADYIKPFNDKEFLFANKTAGFTTLSPELSLKTGGEDAFDGIVAAARGFYAHSGLLTVSDYNGNPTSNWARPDFQGGWLHVFPFSVGTETTRDFSNVNMIAEFGYSPWHFSLKDTPLKIGPGINLGLFAQVGYKIEDAVNTGAGGNVDSSEEEEGDMLLRLKFAMRSRPIPIRMLDFQAFGKHLQSFIQPEAAVWYDIANSQVYYSAGARFLIHMDKKKALNFSYSKGSGAPNFNEGDQFSAGLRISF